MNSRRGFTLIELLVVIAIIAILAAILFPVFSAARNRARQATCASNMKQIGLAVTLYMQDTSGRYPVWRLAAGLPYKGGWFDSVQRYSRTPLVAKCPADTQRSEWDTDKGYGNYWKNVYLDMWSVTSGVAPPTESQVRYTRTTIFIMDGPRGGYGGHTWWAIPSLWAGEAGRIAETRHNGGANMLFCDWHVGWHTPDQVNSNYENSPEGNWLAEANLAFGSKPTGRWLDKNDGSNPWFRPD